jgi:hypothetical protein
MRLNARWMSVLFSAIKILVYKRMIADRMEKFWKCDCLPPGEASPNVAPARLPQEYYR